MNEELERALNSNRAAIVAALSDAQMELAALQTRQRELISQIGRAEAVLRALDPEIDLVGSVRAPTTLHDAMTEVLEASGRAMKASEIAEAIGRASLYQKRDGSAVDPGQIHARVSRYDHMFERTADGIRLKPHQ